MQLEQAQGEGTMRRLKAVALATLALSICAGAGAATVASAVEAEEPNNPRVLILTGNVSELKGVFKGEAWLVETTDLKSFAGLTSTATLANCESISGKPLDLNLCKDVAVTFFDIQKEKKVTCSSENLKKEKAALGEVKMLADLHIADEKSTEGVLQPIIIALVLGIDLEPVLLMNCGGVKQEVKGKFACLLLPGLTNVAAGGNVEILCKQKEGVLETGTCEETKALCELLAKEPLEANFGVGFKAAALAFHLLGTFNKDIYIDD
jgi:hypothetical protein